jgi:hypothetical protein
MNDQRRWLGIFAIDKENYQLTTALVGSMVRTRAIGMGEPCNLEIESGYNT